MAPKLLVVGGGKMGEALVRGLLRAGWARPGDLVLSEVSPARRSLLADEPELAGVALVGEELPAAEGTVVAVKPPDVEGVCRRLRPMPGPGAGATLSIAAGVRLADLQAWCGPAVRVVRAMPNTAALVGEAATGISGGPGTDREDIDWAASLMSSVGSVVEVPEALLDAVTGLSGSGPAYLFLVAEAMTEAGVLAGLPRDVSARLVTQTFVGAARLLSETGSSPEALRAAVTSPAGTTAAGLRQLEARGTRSAFIEAVAAATDRSRQLAPAPSA